MGADFTNRYLAVLNEEDENVQRNHLIELWAPDVTYVGNVSQGDQEGSTPDLF